MIQEFVKKWDKNKERLREQLTTYDPDSLTYNMIVYEMIRCVINDSENNWENYDLDNVTEIDNGDYQGTQIYIIPKNTYQPSINDYIWTHNYYGSCSGCDTLLSIVDIESEWNHEKLDQVMQLALNILQNFKYLDNE